MLILSKRNLLVNKEFKFAEIHLALSLVKELFSRPGTQAFKPLLPEFERQFLDFWSWSESISVGLSFSIVS